MRCRIIEKRKKREKLIQLHGEIQGYLRKKEELQRACAECDRTSNCSNCSESKLIKLLEADINYTKRKINKIEWDVNTWSYTILGNKKARDIDDDIVLISIKYITKQEMKKYNYEYPEDLRREFFERAFDEIVSYVLEQDSRLAFQVLGWNILYYGAKMPEEIRELILLHSEWEDEQEQLRDARDLVERRHWLSDFYERVKNYKEGFPIKIHHILKEDVYERQQSDRNGFIIIDREPIKD